MNEYVNESRIPTVLNFFTIYLGEEDPILNHSKYWIEYFGIHFDRIDAYATHVEAEFKSANNNINISQIGGGTPLKKIIAIFKLVKVAIKIIKSNERNICFFHMTTRALLVIGPILRLFQVPIFLWYSHQAFPYSLRLSLGWLDAIFSPTKKTFPVQTNKVIATGHGLNLSRMAENIDFHHNVIGDHIIVVGRIARVKRIENLLIALSGISGSPNIVECIGPLQDASYFRFLKDIASDSHVEIRHLPSMASKELYNYVSTKGLVYSGTQGSVDKAPLEAVGNGCLLISTNEDLLNISGMNKFWWDEFQLHGHELSLQKQLSLLTSVKVSHKKRKQLVTECREKNDLSRLACKISIEMLKYA